MTMIPPKINKLPDYDPHTFQPNKIPKDLWKRLQHIIYEEGYLCYHDDWGCHHVLRSIVNILHEYKIMENKTNDNDTSEDQKASEAT